ncbi:nucleoside phosphorylase [Thermodesulfobacteriota bacterium]
MQLSPNATPVIRPVKNRNSPELGPVSVMAATTPDFHLLKSLMGFEDQGSRLLYTANLVVGSGLSSGISLCGPFIGAPYGAMILETLIAWGVTRIVFMGWCGAISKDVHIGDMIVPNGALVDEGTSLHYQRKTLDLVPPSNHILKKTRQSLDSARMTYHEGLVWTIDAAFRETREAVLSFQEKGILAVEMELSALLSVGMFYGVDVGGLLVVSDELSSLTWKPGFKSEQFKQARKDAAMIVRRLCEALT